MKLKNVFGFVLMIAVVIAAFVSCTTDDSKTGAKDVSSTIKGGTWKLSYFYDSSEDKTSNYAGYTFTFGNYTVLEAKKETNSYTGTWSVSKSTSDDDLYSTIFMVAFGSPDILLQLSRNWKVLENTGSSLKLKDDSKGDMAPINYLTFEKIHN